MECVAFSRKKIHVCKKIIKKCYSKICTCCWLHLLYVSSLRKEKIKVQIFQKVFWQKEKERDIIFCEQQSEVVPVNKWCRSLSRHAHQLWFWRWAWVSLLTLSGKQIQNCYNVCRLKTPPNCPLPLFIMLYFQIVAFPRKVQIEMVDARQIRRELDGV